MSSTQPTNAAAPPPSERTRVRRLPARADYSKPTVHAILDEGVVAHVGFVVGSVPYVIPMVFARVGERLYLHGSVASRMLRRLRGGVEVCVTVTLVDGLVLARSAFHHSMNYRSVVVLGTAREVTGTAERSAAFNAFIDRLVAGRSAEVRAPSSSELAQTLLLSVPLDEASAKVRTGPPVDDEEDYDLPVWAGVIPLELVAAAPVPDPRLGGDARWNSSRSPSWSQSPSSRPVSA